MESSCKTINSAQQRRFARHTVLSEIGEAGQLRIMNARVLCIGAGGLGSPVMLYLAAAGVGTLGIVDFDVVDESNLQRQIIFDQSDLGSNKTDIARQKLLSINPNMKIETHNLRIDRNNAIEIISKYDLVIDGTDNFATRYLINDACVILSKPCIWGSIFKFDGQVSVFWSEHGPCYRCLHPTPPPQDLAPNCAVGGVLGVMCATIGSIQATEALKLIVGFGVPLVGTVVIYNSLDNSFEKISLLKDPNCFICSSDTTKKELLLDYEDFCGDNTTLNHLEEANAITSKALQNMVNNGDEIQLIDVRTISEWEISRIEGAVLIPLSEFESGDAYKKVSRNSSVVLYCRTGNRSATCLSKLQERGYEKVLHLEGGIQAWEQYLQDIR